MPEENIRARKGKNFKEVIEQEKKAGKTFKKFMKVITGINSSIVYGFSFLLMFVTLDALIYFFLSPGVLIWAGILVVVAVPSSILASYLTNKVKKQQWKYASY